MRSRSVRRTKTSSGSADDRRLGPGPLAAGRQRRLAVVTMNEVMEREVEANLLEETIVQALENQGWLKEILENEAGYKIHSYRNVEIVTGKYGSVNVKADVEIGEEESEW